MALKQDFEANNARFKQRIDTANTQFKEDMSKTRTPKARAKTTQSRRRNLPTWQIVVLLIFLFPLGLYLLWHQQRWSKRTKTIGTWASVAAGVAGIILLLVLSPPTVTLTSPLTSTRLDAYQLTGKVTPTGSQISVNGRKATLSGDTFSVTVSLTEGNNSLKIVAISANKRTEKTFTIHCYTGAEIAAQEKATADIKAASADAQAKADATAAEKNAAADAAAQTKQQQDATAKAKADADAAAKTAQNKAAADAAAQARADAAAITLSQKNALSKAKSYLGYTALSHDGLVEQLEYEQFSHNDAVYGADHVGADWNAQAAKKAKDYLNYTSFSRGGLIDQLEYDKFTPDQAVYGVNAVGL